MDRRDILKGLIGAPVALLLGGEVVKNAGVFEEREGSALVVPKKELVAAPQAFVGYTAPSEGVTHFESTIAVPVVLLPGDEIVVSLGLTPSRMALTSIRVMFDRAKQEALISYSGAYI